MEPDTTAATTADPARPLVTEWPRQPLDRDRSVPESGEGHGWIQWKGTQVCIDLWCRCGAHGHVDADFFYFYRCAACGSTFAVGQTVRLYEIDPAWVADIAPDPDTDEKAAP